jgi:hypothetical protein
VLEISHARYYDRERVTRNRGREWGARGMGKKKMKN